MGPSMTRLLIIKLTLSKMMRLKTPLLLLPAAALVVSCINDDYDLSDIDSTVQVTVSGLSVPINVDEITLEAVLDLDDDSRIKNVNGEYAVVEDGTFSSSAIHVPSFSTKAPSISPIEDDLSINISLGGLSIGSVNVDTDQQIFNFDLSDKSTWIDVDAEDVDEAIVSVDHIGIDGGSVALTLTFDGLEDVADELHIEDLELQIMKGLDASPNIGSYNPETGVLSIEDVSTTDQKLSIVLAVTGIGSKSGMQIDEEHTFSLAQECNVVSGRVTAYASDILPKYFDTDGKLNLTSLSSAMPDYVSFTCAPAVSALEVTAFSGKVNYGIDGIDIDPVELNDLPDLLSQSGTNIILDNPQIYLQLNNPVFDYSLYATAGLQISSVKGASTADYLLDEDLLIDEADNKYCLSPSKPDAYYAGTIEDDGQAVDFSACQHETFSTLGHVLSGDGLPNLLEIYVVDPQIPVQSVENFALGVDLDAVNGVYVFYAPLELTANANIVYTDTIDGWNDEDVDKITITELVVNADLSTDVPMELEIYAYPIDIDGNRILSEGKEVVGSVDKNISYGFDEPIEITISGTITHLDGIILEAKMKGTDETDEPLQPSQTIALKNIRATVSGTYEKEL